MEHNLKKKSKQLINLKSNNSIQAEIEKDFFFGEVLNTLQNQLESKEFQFLTTCLLQDNNSLKHPKHSMKTMNTKIVMTQPDQKIFSINDIDPSLFQQNRKVNTFLRNSQMNKQSDHHCTSTPKRKVKQIVFENKKLMDLDKKITQKYQNLNRKSQANQSANIYIPNLLSLSSNRRSIGSNEFFIKTSFKKSSIKRTQSKMDMRRLKTSFGSSRQDQISKLQMLDSSNKRVRESVTFARDFSFRKSECNEIVSTQRKRRSQDSVPRQLLDQVLLSRRENKIKQLHNDFSDFKLSSRYKDCFN